MVLWFVLALVFNSENEFIIARFEANDVGVHNEWANCLATCVYKC